MKKIMFDDRFWLTRSVLDGSKTMTRRVVSIPETWDGMKVHCAAPNTARTTLLLLDEEGSVLMDEAHRIAHIRPAYRVGEVVAVAQSYMDAGYDPHMLQFIYIKEPTILPFSDGLPVLGYVEAPIMYHAGWKNKMFVYPTMMPHQIRITNVRVERLQDISYDDILREGIELKDDGKSISHFFRGSPQPKYSMGRDAFAVLIDKVSGKGTWQSNPWVFVYKFRLIK